MRVKCLISNPKALNSLGFTLVEHLLELAKMMMTYKPRDFHHATF